MSFLINNMINHKTFTVYNNFELYPSVVVTYTYIYKSLYYNIQKVCINKNLKKTYMRTYLYNFY